MFGSSSKTAKCKTQLKMVVSRIKILRNKREIKVKHLRRDVAQLLQNKQDANARTRAEHAIRDQNMLDAYSLIEGYCNFLDSRIQSLSGQKECPPDLKEAVSSLIYAGPRCADLPELLEIRSIFTSKFGKQFIATIVELRVGCGVSRMIVEKLSSQAISTETKVKFMHAVAKEHNVKWQPEDLSAGEVKQPAAAAAAATTKTPSPVPIITKTIQEDRNSSPKSPLSSSVRSTAAGYEAGNSEPDSEDEKEEASPVPVHQPAPQRSQQPQRFQQDNQFIPFVPASKAPDPYAQYNKGIVNPYVTQQAPVQQSPPSGDPYAEYQRKFMANNAKSPYLDVASAAEAAAESADQAAAAARAAANLAHRHLSRESSMASVTEDVPLAKPVRKLTPADLDDRVASYLQTHVNDTDSSDWDSPLPRDETGQFLNPSKNLVDEQAKFEARRQSTGRQQTVYNVDKRLSLGAARARQDVDPNLFRTETVTHVSTRRVGKPVFDGDNRLEENEEMFFQRPVFDEAPAAAGISRLDSFTVNLESMNDNILARTERLFEKEDSDHSPTPARKSTKNVEKKQAFGGAGREEGEAEEARSFERYSFGGGPKHDDGDGDGDDSRLSSGFEKRAGTKFERQDEETIFSSIEVKVSSSKPGGEKWSRVENKSRNSHPPSRSPPKVPSDSTNERHLNFQRQFRGAGVDYTETPSLAPKKPHRFAGASVRTKRT